MNSVRVEFARWSALAGMACAAPFLLVNAVVANRIEPLFSLLRPGVHTGPLEYPLLAALLVIALGGAVVALWPLLRRDGDGMRRLPILNLVVAGALIAGVVLVGVTLGTEIYACDIAGVPNCD